MGFVESISSHDQTFVEELELTCLEKMENVLKLSLVVVQVNGVYEQLVSKIEQLPSS